MYFWRENSNSILKKDHTFSKNLIFFFCLFISLQISQLCNASTHDKVAPTPQNLICYGKSATEIILLTPPNQLSHLQDKLNLTFVQNQPNKNGLIIMDSTDPAEEAMAVSISAVGAIAYICCTVTFILLVCLLFFLGLTPTQR